MLLLGTFRPVLAHTEGKMQLSAEPAGPFKMTVFTSPDPAVTGEIHVAALIFLAEDASPLLDANVTVEMEPLEDSGSVQRSPAVLGEAENKLLFEAVLDISAPGPYLVTVSVEEGGGQSGEASFEMDVTSEGGFNWLYLIPVILIGLVVAVWAVNRNSRRQQSSGERE
jgi:hypothetical protein